MKNEWLIGLTSMVTVLGVSAGIAWAGSSHGVAVAGWPVFLLAGVFVFALQWLVFVHAWLARTEKFFDLTGSVTFIVMMGFALILGGARDIRSYMLVGLIVVWALRLGAFLYARIRRAGEDRRFRSMKRSLPTFLMTWTLQGAWVLITASCALAAVTGQHVAPLGLPFAFGLALWIFGFVVEVLADRQKRLFRSNPNNAGRFINTGLWAWSRHPNYFGEIVLWLGIAIMAYPALIGWQLATLMSPLFVIVLLTRISGMRMLEYRANKLWGDQPDYQDYKRSTPGLMLWPPSS